MLDESLYNYYLKEVLGISNYISMDGVDETVPEIETALSYSGDVIFVTETAMSSDEQQLLQNISNAVKIKSFQHLLDENFDLTLCRDCKVVCFTKDNSANLYQPEQFDSNVVFKSSSLSQMLAPTNPSDIKSNKQNLWACLKKIF